MTDRLKDGDLVREDFGYLMTLWIVQKENGEFSLRCISSSGDSKWKRGDIFTGFSEDGVNRRTFGTNEHWSKV